MKNSSNSGTGDPFLLDYSTSELKIASEFLSTWLPFLSRDLCTHCTRTLSDRVRSLHQENQTVSMQNKAEAISCTDKDCDTNSLGSWKDGANDTADTNSIGCWKDDGWSEGWKDGANGWSEASTSNTTTTTVGSVTPVQKVRMSWADMAQQDELEAEEETAAAADEEEVKIVTKTELTREQRELIRFSNVGRKKDFICLERVGGRILNILDGLELHTGVFSAVEQKRIIDYVYSLEEMGKNGELKERTYTAPVKWMRGKGRVTIQFGCCYNYSYDKNGNPPGILQTELVDPIPPLFKVIIRRLVRWHVLPPTCVPDSCIVNIYDEGDCIPPHIDNHDFVRPFCTVSFLSECNIVFGSTLKIVAPGEFSGPIAIPLPLGSVLVLNGNGADVAKHCVPAVPTKRISITFRKMDESKWPNGFVPEPDLQGLEPLTFETVNSNRSNQSKSKQQTSSRQSTRLDENMQSNTGDRSRGLFEPRISDENRQNNNGDRSRGSVEPRFLIRTRVGPTDRRRRVNIDH